MKFRSILLVIILTSAWLSGWSQTEKVLSDSLLSNPHLFTQYLDQASGRAEKLEKKLSKQFDKALSQLQKLEGRIKKKLNQVDSAKGRAIIEKLQDPYSSLEQRLKRADKIQQYIPSLDSLGTSLKFLDQSSGFLASTKGAQEKLKVALRKVSEMKTQLNKAENIKSYLKERRQYLKEQLFQLGFAKELKKLDKQVYYYSNQLNEYKELLKDHKKTERKVLALLRQTKPFRDFMRKNSQLASLFRLPGDPNDPISQVGLAGLQTRAQVNNLIQQQLAIGGQSAQQQFQQNIQSAQAQLNQLKNKVSQLGQSSSDVEMPQGFKPNNQKTKTFLQRLEVGTNIQSQKASGFFPVTSDIGLSLGYKLNDKSILGVGASYKMGWGRNIRSINITHQGVAIRGFADWKIRGYYWLTGGFEMNYRNEFKRIDDLKMLDAWQQCGLIGVSKVISLKTKFFKKTKLQLLWDILSYQQVPRTQPILFRIGYSFK